METKANHFLVGLFVLIMSMGGVGFVYWTQKLGNSGSTYYTIDFQGEVGGLTKASQIYFNGIPVGRVNQLAIDPVDGRKTHVTIMIRRDIPVRENSSARIETNMLTGTAKINLSAGTPDSPVLVSEDNAIAVIAATPVSGKSMLEGAPDLISNSNALILRMNELVANNERLVRQSVQNIQAFTQALEDNKDNITRILGNAAQLTENLNEATVNINQLVTANKGAITNTLKNFESVSAEISAKKKDIGEIITNAKTLTVQATNITSQLELLVAENRVSLGKTMKNVEEFTGVLAQNKDHVGTVLQDATLLTTRFKAVAAKIEKTVDEFSGFKLDEEGNSIIAEAKSAVSSFKNLADKLDKSFGDKAIGLAKGADRSLKDFQGMMRDVRNVTRNLNTVIEKIGNHPLLGGEDVPTYSPANQ